MRQVIYYFFIILLFSCNNKRESSKVDKKGLDLKTTSNDSITLAKLTSECLYTSPDIGDKIENFVGIDSTGEQYSLLDFKNKYILLVFSIPNCGVCYYAIPETKCLQTCYLDSLTIVGVNKIKPLEKRAWIHEPRNKNITWTNLMEEDREDKKLPSEANCIRVFPSYILLNSDYIIIDKWVGYRKNELIERVEMNMGIPLVLRNRKCKE